jgi:hypothetical protein
MWAKFFLQQPKQLGRDFPIIIIDDLAQIISFFVQRAGNPLYCISNSMRALRQMEKTAKAI